MFPPMRGFGRVFSFLVVAAGWLLLGVRLTMDAIGYSTIPEDVEVARNRLEQALAFVIDAPWWVPWGFAIISTALLLWLSWPRVPLGLSERGHLSRRAARTEQSKGVQKLGHDCIQMARRIRRDRGRQQDTRQYFIRLRPELASLTIRIQQAGVRSDVEALNFKDDYHWLLLFFEYYLADIGPLLRDGHLVAAKATAEAYFTSQRPNVVNWHNRPRAEVPVPPLPQGTEPETQR